MGSTERPTELERPTRLDPWFHEVPTPGHWWLYWDCGWQTAFVGAAEDWPRGEYWGPLPHPMWRGEVEA